MNSKYLPTTLLIAVIVILFSLFSFYLYNTRAISETRLVLEIQSTNESKNEYTITNLDSLETIVSNLNHKIDDKNLLAIYEREREHYIMLLTVLGLLLTISIAYTIINHIVEKSEVQEQEKRIAKIEAELELELNNLKRKNIINAFIDFCHELHEAKSNYYDDNTNTIITTEDDFIRYIKYRSKDMLKLIKDDKIDKKLQTRAVYIRNFINSTIVYCEKKGYLKDTAWNAKTNRIFKTIIIWLEDTLGREKYLLIKEQVCKLPYVEWKE